MATRKRKSAAQLDRDGRAKTKKTEAQLEREIAVAIGDKPVTSIKFPSLQVTKVRPEGVDEWYGVRVDFKWKAPFDYEAYKRELNAETKTWFGSNPRQMHVGLWPLEEKMGAHIRREIGRSPEWAEFWTKPHTVRIYDDESGSSTVTLPKFSERDIEQWDVYEQGGSASASDRGY